MKFRRLLGALLTTLTLAVMGAIIPATPAAAAPAIVIWEDYGPIGTVVDIELSGYNSGTANIRISGNSGTSTVNLRSVNINSSGYWSGQITIPSGLVGGAHRISVSTSASTYETFTITPQITSISPDSGSAGTSVTIQGNGFVYPSPSYYVYFDGTRVTPTSGSVNSSGELTNFRITVPSGFTRGDHTISMEDRNNSLEPTNDAFFVIESSLTVTPDSGGPGEILTLTGVGFSGGQVTIYFDAQSVKTVTVPTSGANAGNFSTTIVVPGASSGEHTITAQDANGEASATFTISQQIEVFPAEAVSVGEEIIVKGNGFSLNQPVAIYLDDERVDTSPYTSSTGTFETSFHLPPLAKGEHTVKAQVGSGTPSTATIIVKEKLTVTPKNGVRGGNITVSGTGFTPGAASVSFDGSKIDDVTISNNGSFEIIITVPATATPGTHKIAVQSIEQEIVVDPVLVLTPSSVSQGEAMTVEGIGFRPNKNITFTVDGIYSLSIDQASVTTNQAGNFSATFKAPNLPNGQHTITAADNDDVNDNERKTGSGQITIKPNVDTLSPNTGKSGDQVSLLGTGFAANRPITITFGGQAVNTNPSSVTTNEWGWFQAIFDVPAMTAGAIVITLSDGTNSATANFALQSVVTVDRPTSSADPGWVGMSVIAAGSGFKANSTVNVTFDDDPAIIATGLTNAQGSLSISINIPPMVAGAHTMIISDGTIRQELEFVMEGDAPPAPVLVKPATNTKPKQPVVFSWNAVDDPSGVIYEIQISQDATFDPETLTFDPVRLTGTTVTLPEDLKLPSSGKTPYLWRVRAIDGAGNASEWSTVNTFSIGFIWPSWLIHIWYSMGILVALGFGIWFGRRMAYQSY